MYEIKHSTVDDLGSDSMGTCGIAMASQRPRLSLSRHWPLTHVSVLHGVTRMLFQPRRDLAHLAA